MGRGLSVVVAMVVAMLSLPSNAQAPGAAPPAGAYPQIQSSHCRYLINAPSPWGKNASPFKLFTRSYASEVQRGYPIEVSILPSYQRLHFFNFSDFALWAEPCMPAMGAAVPIEAQPAIEFQPAGAAGLDPMMGGSQLGVWQVYPQYANGATTMKCNPATTGDDVVGSYEYRLVEIMKVQFSGDYRLNSFQPSARSGASFLWYPDESAMRQQCIKFVAKLNSMGQWFHLESTSWNVHRPPPPRRINFGNFVDSIIHLDTTMRQMEHRLDRAGTPGI